MGEAGNDARLMEARVVPFQERKDAIRRISEQSTIKNAKSADNVKGSAVRARDNLRPPETGLHQMHVT